MEIPEDTDPIMVRIYESESFEVDGIKYYPGLGNRQLTINYMFEERWDAVNGKATASMPCSREVDMDRWMANGNGYGSGGAVALVPLKSDWRLTCQCEACKPARIKAEWELELELMEGTD
jgi:hypothetical protein